MSRLVNYLGILGCVAFWGCGASVSTDQNLILEMFGVSEVPTGAQAVAENSDPVFHKYFLERVIFEAENGDQVELQSSSDQGFFTIVDRNQIIFTKEISGLVDNTYTRLLVQFSTAVSGGRVIDGKVDEGGSFNLSSATVTYIGVIAIETGKGLTFHIKVNWRDTVDASGNLTEPTLEIIEP